MEDNKNNLSIDEMATFCKKKGFIDRSGDIYGGFAGFFDYLFLGVELKKNIKYTKKQRDFYLKYGGLPRLDKDYTVFGEIVEGLDVILTISKQKTASNDYPIKKIVFSIQEL